MGLAIAAIIYLRNIATRGAVLLILAHGFSSSRIFFGGNSFYLRKFSRRIILIKKFLTILPLLSFFWLITIIRRMATPPLLILYQKSYVFVYINYIDFERSLNSFISIFRRR